ncbi:hypothetical protein QP166_07125 [Sphingomonas sp. LR60]|uniref:hypothetical protein n=1 Tax=Sphingomonas sp. LR60 TaxID=3050233 RepID=UPI002FE2C7CF
MTGVRKALDSAARKKRNADTVVDSIPLPALDAQLTRMRDAIAAQVAALPDHDTYLARCVA